MRVLWLCNVMLPKVAEYLHMEATNKEGWLSGLADVVLERQGENGIELAVACPVPAVMDGLEEHITVGERSFTCYGFYEDTASPHRYDVGLEKRMQSIVERFAPDIVHCYGTEYPHTLAMCRVFPKKERILVGIQGLCSVYANTYFANLPQSVIRSVTLRDLLKRDTIKCQQRKFADRGKMEMEAIRLAGNITGRTDWDKHYANQWHPGVNYYLMNETLRGNFYDGKWDEKACRKHSIFLSQGDYPIKGLHYLLLALPLIREKYPDVKVYVAGNSIVRCDGWKERLKISAYGSYLQKLIRTYDLEKQIVFLGKQNAEQMKEQYLKCHLFVCCSTIENSPNSLGEAMILGVPCVSAEVGGIASIFEGGKDGILYPGFKTSKNSFDNVCFEEKETKNILENNAKALADAVLQMWSDNEAMNHYTRNARKHAEKTHDREQNYQKMTEIYSKIANTN